MVEMNLIEVRTDEFFAQFVCLAAEERHLQPGEGGDQKLRRSVGINTCVGIRKLYLTQRARDYQQPMRIRCHSTEKMESRSRIRKR